MGEMRRHGAELDDAIDAAVLKLVLTRGAPGVTMESVAAAAKTSKPVLYRRWPDCPALLRDVLLRTVVAATGTPPDTGSYRTDMLTVLDQWMTTFAGPHAEVMRTIIATMTHDPDLAGAFRSGVIDWRRTQMTLLLNRGIARGDVRADVPIDIACELAQSVLFHRLLITGEPLTGHLVIRLVDEILVPLTTPPPVRGRGSSVDGPSAIPVEPGAQ